MKNPLLDKDFLYELNQYQHKEIYARIISLNLEEHPLEQIEGRVTSGSINVDGNSAVRRTCNLTLVAKDVNVTDFYWGVSNKFTLEIGVKNFINSNYPEIIWFKQGIFVITSFNSTLSQNNYTISVSGKDKMCLLNGDIGGSLPSSIDFGVIDKYKNTYEKVEIEDYTQYKANKYYILNPTTKEYEISVDEFNKDQKYYIKSVLLEQEKLILKDIIKEAVHTYGKEPYHNIIINDLDDYGLELLEYRGDTPLYMLYDENAHLYDQMIEEKDAKNELVELKTGGSKYISNCVFNNAIDELNNDRDIFYLQIGIDEKKNPIYKEYSVTKIEYGYTAGYRTTDLVYAGDLISSIGESLTSVLDKIKNMLGPFEYFYDLDGRFVFQAKKIYSNNSWNTLKDYDENTFARDAVEESPYSYSFEDVNLIQKFQNTPALNNIKNDYSIWGTRKGVSGKEIPIHARYAIHKKPVYYKSFDGIVYADQAYYENLVKTESDALLASMTNRVKNFEPTYQNTIGLQMPTKRDDGSWTPGWWDIRDWHTFYYLLEQKEPNGTMKWYSMNNEQGCALLTDLGYDKLYGWLIIVNPETGYVNLQHGACSENQLTATRLCTFFTSTLQEDGSLRTIAHEDIQKEFMYPYAGCSDNHTYLEFLYGDVLHAGNLVYFYNPSFLGAESFEDLVDKEMNDKYFSDEVRYVDWREILYQMAKDYYKHNRDKNFNYLLSQNNLKKEDNQVSHYPNGLTGYETFYSDIQGFWRDLYDPEPDIIHDTSGGKYKEERKYEENGITYTIETVWDPFVEEETFTCDFFLKPEEGAYSQKKLTKTEFEEIKHLLYEKSADGEYNKILNTEEYNKEKKYYMLQTDDVENYSKINFYWNKSVVTSPELLNFWIDFYDTGDAIWQYAIPVIGNRPKVVNNSKVTSIYFRNVPQAIFYNSGEFPNELRTGYTYLQLTPGMEDLFTISAQGKSAEEEMNELFNKHSYCSEGISITSIPIYYLEPNTLIYIHNEENQINGKYQVNKITIPLAYNGTMSISATKIIDPVY